MATGISACHCHSSSSHTKLATSTINIIIPITTSIGSGEQERDGGAIVNFFVMNSKKVISELCCSHKMYKEDLSANSAYALHLLCTIVGCMG
jgi:hypothetical protein